jgi:hypothetical protein
VGNVAAASKMLHLVILVVLPLTINSFQTTGQAEGLSCLACEFTIPYIHGLLSLQSRDIHGLYQEFKE